MSAVLRPAELEPATYVAPPTLSGQERAVMRSLARSPHGLYAFSRYMFLARKKYLWQRAAHHDLICDALMRVFRGEVKRLIINIPPRYSKTELAVVNFVAWALGQVPDAEFIIPSYGALLASKNSYDIRELVDHEEYAAIFPRTSVSADSSAKADWRTSAGGAVFAPGVGGTTTGMGAGKMRPGFGGAIIIDDPHKPDEARSDVQRQNVIDWYNSTLQSRVNHPGTPIILIMQRLHERDLAGWLLDGGSGEEWTHLKLSAIQYDARGDEVALWPEKHDLEKLRQMKKAAPYMFAGQYEQEPAPAEGNIFKPGKLGVIEAIPAGTKLVRGWDFAATEEAPGKDPDHTVGLGLGEAPDGRFIIFDLERMRGTPDEVEATLVATAQRDRLRRVHQSLPQDPGQAGKSQIAYLAKKLKGCKFSASPETGDKVTRAEPFAAQVNVGNVLFLAGCPYVDELIHEMRMFPNGTHDDLIDAGSRAFAKLTETPGRLVITTELLNRIKR